MALGDVKLVDSGAVFAFDREAADFQSRREFSSVNAEFVVQEGQFLNFLEFRQVLSVPLDLVHRKIVDFRLLYQFGVRFECDPMLARVRSQSGIIGSNERGDEFPPVAD